MKLETQKDGRLLVTPGEVTWRTRLQIVVNDKLLTLTEHQGELYLEGFPLAPGAVFHNPERA